MAQTEPKAPQPSEPDLDSLLGDVERLEAIVAGWEETQVNTVEALKRALEALNKEALRRLIRALKDEPAAFEAMKGALGDEVVYAVLRHHGLVKPSLGERVEAALDSVRPALASHGGNVELVRLVPPDAVEVRFLGACDSCPASALTFTEGVEKAIKERCPEIVRVEQARGLARSPAADGSGTVHYISPFAQNQQDRWLYAAEFEAVPEGGILALEIEGEPVILSRHGDRVSCFQNACAHLGMPIDDGEIGDGTITCRFHGFRYSLISGECLTAPEVQLQPHAVRVVETRVEVRLAK